MALEKSPALASAAEDADFALLYATYLSGQISEPQWQLHLGDTPKLREWLADFEVGYQNHVGRAR